MMQRTRVTRAESDTMAIPVEEPRGRKRGRLRAGLSLLPFVLIIILIALIVLWLIPANDYLIMPGQALNVETMISTPGHPEGNKTGKLLMTDVSLYKANHLIEVLYGRLNPDTDIQSAPAVSGNLSPAQYNQYNVELMTNSIQDAEAAALSHTSLYKPRFAKTGPKIVYILPGSPAATVLKVGDVVEAVDGQRTLRVGQIGPLIRKGHPGRIVRLRILRHLKLMTIPVATEPSANGTPSKTGKTPLIGIVAQDQIVFPIKIAIRPGNIIGPSAGLMFALGIVQRLSPTDITHGCKIAGTGTIDFQGDVGEIGGAKQKIIAARHAGAKYFFVPDVKANRDPALAHRGDVVVVPVKTLGQALGYLKTVKSCR
jgi:PDZ domain-containing protein